MNPLRPWCPPQSGRARIAPPDGARCRRVARARGGSLVIVEPQPRCRPRSSEAGTGPAALRAAASGRRCRRSRRAPDHYQPVCAEPSAASAPSGPGAEAAADLLHGRLGSVASGAVAGAERCSSVEPDPSAEPYSASATPAPTHATVASAASANAASAHAATITAPVCSAGRHEARQWLRRQEPRPHGPARASLSPDLEDFRGAPVPDR